MLLRFWSFTLLFLLIKSTFLFSQANQEIGYLKIVTDIPGIEIQINGKLAGYTKMPELSLIPGKYTVTALHPNRHLWGNLDWQQQILIVPNDTLIIFPEFPFTLNIRTNPFDAEVFIDDELKGKTPLTVFLEKGKSNDILIRKPGYESFHTKSLQIKENYLTITLLKNENSFSKQFTSFNSIKKKKEKYRKLAYGLWGASVLSGLATVYLKNEAEDWYDKYLSAGSLSNMNNYYQQSKDYDNYTLISLGVLQGCFGLSFYFLINSL